VDNTEKKWGWKETELLDAGVYNNSNSFLLRFRTNANGINERGDVDQITVKGSYPA